MASPVFAIAASTLASKVNPAGRANMFSIGALSTDQLTESLADDILRAKEEMVLSYLPEKYRQTLLKVETEIVEDNATAGQTSIQLGLYPVTGASVRLYVNYSGAWNDRDDSADGTGHAIDWDELTITEATGAVTLSAAEALSAGDFVLAEYDHTGATTFYDLIDHVVTLAAVEVGRRFNYFDAPEAIAVYNDWESHTMMALRDYSKGKRGIHLIDELDLRNETRTAQVSDLGLDG